MIAIFGNIANPTAISSTNGSGLFTLLSNLFKLAGVVAGIFFVVQIILAGFGYLSASGDPKKTEVAFAKIWQSILGLAIVASAFVLAAVIGSLTGINILNPTIYGP
jgi:succinate dehydrogenase/fumarate reductase cytochrome b subunit